ncbi:hypothetical protein BJY01DRAFT_164535 [Aspergillus pseudoustus]|uniref:Mid2 domain-containing protein n=1 Tax=Aspergillus pseudoustus TaxID=1810923 RepID=A0ABR4K669_9EURO
MSETSSIITEHTSTGATTTEGPQTTPITTPAPDTIDYADRPTSNESNNNMGVIVGGIIGGIGVLGLLLALIWLVGEDDSARKKVKSAISSQESTLTWSQSNLSTLKCGRSYTAAQG